MEFLTGWIANIIVFILLATIVDMLLPNSNLQRYAKMVTGLLLIVIILTPLFKFFSTNFEEILATATTPVPAEEENIENLIEFKKKEIQALNRAYSLEEVAVQMKEGVADEMMKRFDLHVSHVFIELDESINASSDSTEHFSVIVQLSEQKVETEDAIPVVKEVKIDTSKELPKKDNIKVDETKIVSYLATEWQLNPQQINVALEGGESDLDGEKE
ncbi:stage III sporulation protein AF [Bacillus mesophilus]|uniref:Stage III sporulation protein AF n=1 Tax=Bacillus mesophilus TaxID=1808955 RepID=A0A6M0Q5M5_9BACI|nr:stage III sporulation protein AF [Bacillus mesophilus]MBM7660891.1 stage III sporulation protein AF [Bacillus mesophilus]NEY71563.1 stage III sporulation protein AF [Bacillus mesophilus]